MKLAILGGSFNPIHIAHLHLADSAISAFGFDRLLLVPANISPFKQPHNTQQPEKHTHFVADPADRLDMILASITGDPRISVEDLELRRGGVSYTIDSIGEIIERYRPEGKPALLLGDDLIADFSKWKDAERLARIADIIIARRLAPGGSGRGGFPYPHRLLDNEVMNVSSAMIRTRIAEGKAWRYLVPRGARFIIEDKGLYSAGKTKNSPRKKTFVMGNAINDELIAQVEDAARAALSAKRFIHSRNTALMTRDLALRYGLDAGAAYLAGIAHDMAKNQNSDLNHGKAAAVLLQKRFGIHNKDVVEAIEVHTTGKPRMGDLAKALFIADKIEFSRSNAKSGLRDMAAGECTAEGKPCTLDELFYAVLQNNVNWLKETGIEAAQETIRLLEEQ